MYVLMSGRLWSFQLVGTKLCSLILSNEVVVKQCPLSYTVYQTESRDLVVVYVLPEHIYNPIMAMGFSAMFTLQLDNTKR